MDPITTAIVAALAAGVLSGTQTVAAQAVQDAYAALKAQIRAKFGDESDLADAVDKLEARPDSAPRKSVLAEEVERAGADKDADLLALAQALLEALPPQGDTYTATLTGDGAIAQGKGATAVGKGGVYIGGDARGNTIVTGDGNEINS